MCFLFQKALFKFMKFSFQLLLFSILTYFSWNFFGLLFIVTFSLYIYILKTLLTKRCSLFLILSFLLNLCFNLSVGFWLLNVSLIEGFLALCLNSIFMMFPSFLTYLFVSKRRKLFSIIFIILWMLYEILQTEWSLSWPWLTLGNSMGSMYYIVQWYSIFGVYSGSLWILILANLLCEINFYQFSTIRGKLLVAIFIIPCLSSLYMFFTDDQSFKKTIGISVYIPKSYNGSNYEKTKELYTKLISYSPNSIIVCPEVFLSSTNIMKYSTKSNFYLNKYLAENPKAVIVCGMEIKEGVNLYNAVCVNNETEFLFRLKQKFVPFREYTPYLLTKLFKIKSYYSKSENDFTDYIRDKLHFSPLICYESIFSFYSAKIMSSSHFSILVTSEDFMNDSKYGKYQYLNIVRLRAIENQQQILKCSYRGISCIVNEKGNVVKYLNSDFQNVNIEINTKGSVYQMILGYQ